MTLIVDQNDALMASVEEAIETYRNTNVYMSKDEFLDTVVENYHRRRDQESGGYNDEYRERVRTIASTVWNDVVAGDERWDRYPMNTRVD